MFKYKYFSSLLCTVLLFAVLTLVLWPGCGGVHVTTLFDNGAVVTSAPLATEAGLKVLEKGGNAFDAAVAVGFVLAVVHPQAGNIGGGGFAVIRDSHNKDIRALDFREKAPMAATETMYLDENGDVVEGLSTVGAKAAGVPGTVAGLYELHHEYGSLPWEDLVRLAADLADSGFVVDDYLAQSFADYRDALTQFSESARIFYPEGRSLKAGEKFIQKSLAASLYSIASDGPDAFYRGRIAEQIDSCMKKHDGLITREDLVNYTPVWREPVHFKFDSLDIYSMPPPSSGGITVGQILKLIEPYDFALFTSSSPEYIHLFAEACRLAYADRAEHLGDPDFVAVPDNLLDDAYLDYRRESIDPHKASNSEQVSSGNPYRHEGDNTTHYSIIDKDGNMVAVTYTLNTNYGSKLVVDGAGFLLNNEMDDFSMKPGVPNTYGLVGAEANKIEPGKRMLSSMSPTLVFKNEEPFLILGTPGGSKIITTVASAIINFTRFNLNIEETVAHPRYHHQWLPDILYLEKGGFDIKTKQTLIRMGHRIQEREPYGDLNMIYINEAGLRSAASDPRQRGVAAGY